MLIDNPLIIPKDSGCTGIVSLPQYSSTATSGHLWLARNFDFEGGESFARQKSLTLVIPPTGQGIPFAHVAWPGLAGCVTGINAQHIALFLNAAASSDFARIGTPTIFMARDILQHAASLDDAERIIRSTHTFVSDIIVVADGKTGHARIFEKSPAATASYDVTDSAAVTNHFITPRFAHDPVNLQRIADGTTMQRYSRARELLDTMKGHVTPENLAQLLRDKKGPAGQDIGLGNRNAIDALIACHSVIIDATAGKIWIAAWPNAEGTSSESTSPPPSPKPPPNPSPTSPPTPFSTTANGSTSSPPAPPNKPPPPPSPPTTPPASNSPPRPATKTPTSISPTSSSPAPSSPPTKNPPPNSNSKKPPPSIPPTPPTANKSNPSSTAATTNPPAPLCSKTDSCDNGIRQNRSDHA